MPRSSLIGSSVRAQACAVTFTCIASFLAAAPALAAWPHDPSVNVRVSTGSGPQHYPQAVSDGAGGAFVAWQDQRDDAGNIYVQRVAATGAIAAGWPAGGVAVCVASGEQSAPQMVSDDAGGTYVTWTDARDVVRRVYAQRVTSTGAIASGWPANGLAVLVTGYDEFSPAICGDGAGGAYIAWHRVFSPSDWDLVATRLLPTGGNAAGFPIGLDGAGGFQSDVDICPDGAGGMLAAYETEVGGGIYDIATRRVSFSGAISWSYTLAHLGNQIDPAICSDGSGGALVAYTNGISAFVTTDVHRVGSTGALIWDRVALQQASSNMSCRGVVTDGARGVYVLGRTNAFPNDEWRLTRLYSGGTHAPGWGGSFGQLASDATFGSSALASDGKGGAFTLTWGYSMRPVSLARWAPAGYAAVAWPPASTGTLVSTEDDASSGSIVPDGNGGAIVVWADFRAEPTNRVFAQRVERFGQLGNPEPSIVSVKDVANDQGGFARVAWTPSWLDADPTWGVWQYRLWKQVPVAAAQAALARGAAKLLEGDGEAPRTFVSRETGPASAEVTYWELVGSQLANGQLGYSLTVATAGDSTAAGAPRTQFMVEAVASSGAFWDSAPDSGYSVDNIAPAAPAPFSGAYGATTHLSWGRNVEPDLGGYRLYRGTSPGFLANAVTLWAELPDTGYVAPGGGWYWKLTAVDVHGNESPVSLVSPASPVDVADDLPASLAFALATTNPLRGEARLRLALPRSGVVRVVVYDAAGRLVRVLADGEREAGEHALAWDGRDVSGAVSGAGLYFARLTVGSEHRTLRLVKL